MRLIDLINTLQNLYNTYDNEYKEVMGEPEIVIDTFDKVASGDNMFNHYVYGGFSPHIVIEKTDCGTYDILSGFGSETDTKPVWPFPPEDIKA